MRGHAWVSEQEEPSGRRANPYRVAQDHWRSQGPLAIRREWFKRFRVAEERHRDERNGQRFLFG